MSDDAPITELLKSARDGDPGALDAVFQRVYAELRDLAGAQLRRTGPAGTLNTTAVVHEAYLKLARSPSLSFEDRTHFYSVAARVMRQILLNHARHHVAAKRGGGRPLTLSDDDLAVETEAHRVMEIDAALSKLAAVDERLARVVELRYFAGLSVIEVGEILGVTDRTIKRDWQTARAFLYRELHPDEPVT
ncbi:MAG: ECF subfamily RNA polymerase sigma-24 factor [bacterium]|nr:MAG: ECF subfamily RNA polymerase sigma-24 factor [bacterium]